MIHKSKEKEKEKEREFLVLVLVVVGVVVEDKEEETTKKKKRNKSSSILHCVAELRKFITSSVIIQNRLQTLRRQFSSRNIIILLKKKQ